MKKLSDRGLGYTISVVIALIIGVAVGFGGGYLTFSKGGTQYELTVNKNPSDGGSISLSPSGGTYSKGTEVSVTAEAASGYEFNHWSGDVPENSTTSLTVKMNSDKTLTAHFSQSKSNISYEDLTKDFKTTAENQYKFESYKPGDTVKVEVTIDNLRVIQESELPSNIVENWKNIGYSFPITIVDAEYNPQSIFSPPWLAFNGDISSQYEVGQTAVFQVHVISRGESEYLFEWIAPLQIIIASGVQA